MIDQRLTLIHQLLRWTSVGSSKCPIDKIIGSQGYLTAWVVPLLTCVQTENSFTEMLLPMNKFSNQAFKKCHCPVSKTILRYQTVIDQRQLFTNCSVELKLDPRIVQWTKWLVCKAIWQSEEFPDCHVYQPRCQLLENKCGWNLNSALLSGANQSLSGASQVNHSKRRITVVLRIDTPKHVLNESKMQNWYVARRFKSLFSTLALLNFLNFLAKL